MFRWVNPCIEVGGRGEGTPGGCARRLPDDRQLQREARVQAGDAHYVVDGDLVDDVDGHDGVCLGRGRELHLLLCGLVLLAGGRRGGSPVWLAEEHQ